MADKREERLLSLTKVEIAKLLLDSTKGAHDIGNETTLNVKILKSLADKNIELFESHALDSPITAMDYRFYVKNMSKVLDGENIGSSASKLSTIIHKCLHPNAYEAQSKLGSSFKGKLKTLKTAAIGSSDDKSGISQARAQDQIKKAVKHKTNSVYKKLGRKARANNLKGKIAGGLLGMVGLEAFDDKVQEWVEKRDKKKFQTEDKLMEMIEEKENEEREQLEKLTHEIGSKRDLMEKLNDKDSEVARISKTLLERLDLDTKQLKEYVDDRDSSKFLENAINSQLEISDELREKIRKNLDDDDILKSADGKKNLDKDKNPKDQKKNIEDFLKSQEKYRNQEIDEFNSNFRNLSDRILDSFQPRALEETSEILSQNAEIVSNTLPAISNNTETTIENISKVDHSLDQGFVNLARKVGAVEEGTDRIASLLEKQISLQRKMMDNNSNAVSKSSEDKDEDDEAGLDDVLDFFDGGDRKGGKGKKGGKVKGAKGGKLGKLASKVLSPVGKLASSATPFLSGGAKLLGKAALPAAALMSAYEAYQGFDEEKANQLGFDGKTTKGKTNSSISSVLSGLTLGLVDESTIASGLHWQDEIQDSIVNALGGKDSPIGAVVDKIVNPIDSLLDGFDTVSSWFSDDKEKEKEKDKDQKPVAETENQTKTSVKVEEKKEQNLISELTSTIPNLPTIPRIDPAEPLKAQEEPKRIDEKELLEKVFTAAEQLNPVEQFKNITEHMFDSPGAKKVWDKLTDKESIFDSIMNPVGSMFSGLSNSFMSFFSSNSNTSSTGSTTSIGSYPSINYGSGGVNSPNIGQYGGSAVGDGDIDKVNASANMGDVKALLDYGMSFIGKCSYQMGAKDPTSGRCDCSGFVKFLYSRVWGVKGMPDGAAYQFTWNKGKVINSLEELKPGDIYFMNSPAAHAAGRPLGISHVGIYAGGGNLLHCSSKKGVNLMPLNDYYKKWFVGAKRLTEEGGTMGVTSPEAENSPTMTMPASNPMSATGGVMPVGGIQGGLTDPNNPNSIGVGDAGLTVANTSAIPYSNLSNANADKNASKQALEARDHFIKTSLENGVSNSDIAVMLGQLDHESGGFKSLKENLNYSSAERIQKIFGKSLKGVDPRALVNNPEALANVVYGHKNGNKGGSDGWNYRGRGLVQLTGRGNYEQASKALGIDLVNNPDLAADPEVAAKVAAWWHKSKVGYGVDVATATRKINGTKMVGLNDRIAKTQGWMNGRLDTEIARIKGKKDIKNTEPVDGQVEQSLATNNTPATAPQPQLQVPGIASSFVDERRAMPIPTVQADVQSLPVTESVKVPPTRSQELQQQANMMSSIMTPMFNPNSSSGQGGPSPEQAIKWKDWIEDSSLLSLQKFINGGLG